MPAKSAASPIRHPLVERLTPFATTIFAEMSALAVATNSINLGQGFPDTDGPLEVADAAVAAIRSGVNQYPPGRGDPLLLGAIERHQRRFYGLDFDPSTEILVTAGATEAVAASLLALCDADDEVVVFDPHYDSYGACVAMARARLRVVTLQPPDWHFDPDELRAAVTDRTRVVLVNSPHNPTGKVFDRAELEQVAALCTERDLIAVTDEVYEHLRFDGDHVPLISLPGMRERTVQISSAGKTFSFTGWKVGWACASPPLLAAVRTAKQYLTYVNGAPFQPAVAIGLDLDDAFYRGIAESLEARRDQLCDGLGQLGFEVFVPQGTYFATVDVRSVGEADGAEFCRQLPGRCGVVAIPSAVFYEDASAGAPFVRFTFCKRPELIAQALGRLARWRG